MKVKTVTEKINELLKPGISSEDDSDEGANEDTLPRVVDFDNDEYHLPDARSTEFRKKNMKLLSDQSARYKGKITSRKELQDENDSEDYESDNDENDKEADAIDSENDSNTDGGDENEENETSNDNESIDEEESEEDDESEDEVDTTTDVITEKNRQAEIQKGICVQNQLRIWERLLEVRIHSQKLLTKSNQLPAPNESNQTDYNSTVAKEVTEKTCLLLKSLFDLKSTLTTQFSELRNHLKRPLKDSNVLGNYESGEPPLKRIAIQLKDQHNEMRSYRNNVLLKWDDRTKLLTPGAGAKKKLNEDFDIIRKIENALLNKDILISKSRKIQNAQKDEEESDSEKEDLEDHTNANPNIYDDSDFYHQQLRELIEYKTNSSSNLAEVTKQMIELQKMRQKMKKKVDTRASKGRKIRYIVHNKLVNFMAPDDSSTANWTEEAKDELYKSLFAT